MEEPPTIRKIFSTAIEIESDDERSKYLDEACGAGTDLRAEMGGLIQSHRDAGSFLTDDSEATMNQTISTGQRENRSGAQIGPYKLLQQIGEGGMGSVWMAEQEQPVRRMVALKIIKAGMDSKQVIARFEAERQAIALMSHPNIARVLDAGTTESGRPYFVMELVKGVPITKFCDKNKYAAKQRLELFIGVCLAVQHAHQKGVIHRDIKPSNVMVTLHDGVPVVKVIDFGLAEATSQKLTERTVFTAYGQMVGTPTYMSPEQAEMSGLDVDTRTDVYSLGVLLYELMTGTTPIDAESLRKAGYAEMQRIIQQEEAPPMSTRLSSLGGSSSIIAGNRKSDPKRLSQLFRGDLDVIVAKSLDKDRSRRYSTPSDFANDVRRYLNHEPIEAGPPTQWYRLSKFARRNRSALVVSAFIMVSLICGTILANWNSWRATRAERLAEARLSAILDAQRQTKNALTQAEAAESEQRRLRLQAEARDRQSRQLIYASDVRLADQAFRDNDVRAFVDLLDRHVPGESEEDLRGFEWWLLRNQATLNWTSISEGPSACCLTRFSPDGRYLATGHYDGAIRIWNAGNDTLVHSLKGHQSFTNGVDFDMDRRSIVSAGDDHQIRIWDLDSGEELDHAEADEGHAHRVFFWDRGQKLVSSGEASEVRIWSRSPLEVRDRWGGFATTVHHGIKKRLDLSPDRRYVVAADQHETARVYNLDTREVICSLELTGGRFIRCLRFSQDGRWIAGGRYNQEVTVWDAGTGKVVDRLVGHLDDVQDIAFHPKGHLIATSDKSGVVRTWPMTFSSRLDDSDIHADTDAESLVYEHWPRFFVAHNDRVFSLDFSSDGKTLVTGCRDGSIRKWQSTQIPRLHTAKTILEPQAEWVNSSTLAVTDDKRLVFWDLSGEKEISSREFNQPVQSLVVSQKENWFATGHFDGEIRIWNLETCDMIRTLSSHHGTVHSLAVSALDDSLISAGEDGRLLRWNVNLGTFAVLDEFSDRCKDVAVSGPWLAVAVQNEIHLYRLDGSVPPRRLQGHLNSADCLKFSPDGKILASGSDDRTVRLWDVESASEVRVIHGHRGKVESLAFSPDGRTVVSGDKLSTISFSNVETGRLLCSLNLQHYWDDLSVEQNNPWISDLLFSNDGTQLVVGFFHGGYLSLQRRGPIELKNGAKGSNRIDTHLP